MQKVEPNETEGMGLNKGGTGTVTKGWTYGTKEKQRKEATREQKTG